MSKFYGQVSSDQNMKKSSRCGHRSIRSSAQTYEGSLIAVAREIEGKIIFEIEVSDDSSLYGETIFHGTLEQLKERLGDA